MPKLTARVRLQDVYAIKWGGCKAVFAVENADAPPGQQFTDAIPWGTLEIGVGSQPARDQLVIGATYELVITALDPPPVASQGQGAAAAA